MVLLQELLQFVSICVYLCLWEGSNRKTGMHIVLYKMRSANRDHAGGIEIFQNRRHPVIGLTFCHFADAHECEHQQNGLNTWLVRLPAASFLPMCWQVCHTSTENAGRQKTQSLGTSLSLAESSQLLVANVTRNQKCCTEHCTTTFQRQ